jgi:hypothetical protein
MAKWKDCPACEYISPAMILIEGPGWSQVRREIKVLIRILISISCQKWPVLTWREMRAANSFLGTRPFRSSLGRH